MLLLLCILLGLISSNRDYVWWTVFKDLFNMGYTFYHQNENCSEAIATVILVIIAVEVGSPS